MEDVSRVAMHKTIPAPKVASPGNTGRILSSTLSPFPDGDVKAEGIAKQVGTEECMTVMNPSESDFSLNSRSYVDPLHIDLGLVV